MLLVFGPWEKHWAHVTGSERFHSVSDTDVSTYSDVSIIIAKHAHDFLFPEVLPFFNL